MAIGTKICISDELAKKVGELAWQHPGAAVTIAHDDDFAEEEWFVGFEDGLQAPTSYVVNDETGEHRTVENRS